MSEYLECIEVSSVMHFVDNFIKDKKYEITNVSGISVITGENGTQYPVNISNGLAEMVRFDLSFTWQPKFKLGYA